MVDKQTLNPLISLSLGKIRGAQRTSVYGISYLSFEGIPYGQPPVGKLRFKSPQPALPWKGIKNCSENPPIPLQKKFETSEVMGSEVCLNLNVYMNQLAPAKRLPVLVWIFGGGFYMGQANRKYYSPDYFLDRDVIVVTINYRVCSLGFLSVKDPEMQIPGNAGLKDQVLALKWIKHNISHFNGDPQNVTLFGISSGAACVHYHLIMDLSKGLFHKAICMGASALSPWACAPSRNNAFNLAKLHGYAGVNNDRQVVEFLNSLEAEKLVNHDLMSEEELGYGIAGSFGICVEPYANDDSAVPKDPIEMIANGWGNSIPLFIGGTADEGLIARYFLTEGALDSPPAGQLPLAFHGKYDKEALRAMRNKLLDIHVEKGMLMGKLHKSSIDYYSIFLVWHGIHRSILARLFYGSGPTYVYHFDFDSSSFSHLRKRFCGTDLDCGVAHAEEVSYIWFGDFSYKLEPTSREFKMIDTMIGICTNFAKYSNPGIDEWQPVDRFEPTLCFNISNNSQVKISPKTEMLSVWDSLYDADRLI